MKKTKMTLLGPINKIRKRERGVLCFVERRRSNGETGRKEIDSDIEKGIGGLMVVDDLFTSKPCDFLLRLPNDFRCHPRGFWFLGRGFKVYAVYVVSHAGDLAIKIG